MSEGLDLLVVCELNADVIVRLPDPGGARNAGIRFGQAEQLVDGAELSLGSSGAITASAARAQGMRTAVCGVLGADRSGSVVRQLLDELGVQTSMIRVDDRVQTGMTVVLTRPGGDRALLTYLGAMSALRVSDIPAAFAGARHVHISSIYLQTGLIDGLADLLAVRPTGVSVSVDPGWDPAERWVTVLALLPHLDLLLPNEAECLAVAAAAGAREVAAAAGGVAAPSGDAAVEAAARVLAAFGPTVVVKLGARGALSVSPDGVVHRIALEPRVPVDTTGAGDNFDAGYLAARLDGAAPGVALARAVASGAISVGAVGGVGALATRAQVDALAAELEDRLSPQPVTAHRGPRREPSVQETP